MLIKVLAEIGLYAVFFIVSVMILATIQMHEDHVKRREKEKFELRVKARVAAMRAQ